MWKTVAITLCIFLSLNDCPANSKIPNFTGDTLTINLHEHSSSITHYHQPYNYEFDSIPAVAIGLNGIDFSFEQSSSKGQFKIEPIIVNRTSITFEFFTRQHYWSKIQISFWATTRQDIILGQSNIYFETLKNSNQHMIESSLRSLDHKKSVVRTFINGLRVNKSSKIKVQIEGFVKDENTISLHTLVGPSTKLKQIWISYVIFMPLGSSFASYGGVILRNQFKGILHEDLNTHGHALPYFLIGLTKIAFENSLSLSSEVDMNMIFSFQTFGKSVDLGISYMFIGFSPKKYCEKCKEKYYFESICRKQCPSQTYLYNHSEAYSCKKCSSKLNKQINEQKTGCKCLQGYIQDEQNCVNPSINLSPIEEGLDYPIIMPFSKNYTTSKKIIQSQNCLFHDHEYWNGSQCLCKQGYHLNQQNKCQRKSSKCGNSQIEEGQSCDDGNKENDDGCSGNCQIENDWNCYEGTSSLCYKSGYNLRLKKLLVEEYVVYLQVQTSPSFKFDSQVQVEKFFRYSFRSKNNSPQAIDCYQNPRRLNIFYINFIFKKGTPKNVFITELKYQKQNHQGYLPIIMDPNNTKF